MLKELLIPRRIAMMAIAAILLGLCFVYGRWDWLLVPKYQKLMLTGFWNTLSLLVITMVLGMALAIPLGLAQAVGPWYLARPAQAFCGLVRGTPLLLQLFLLYYGIGSLFPSIPGIRESIFWPILRDAWYFAVLGLSLSVAGYEGEVMRGAFAGVPHGELEAARAFGMSRFLVFRRVWFPRAVHRALPTIAGEIILQLKSTPLVATITVTDLYAVITRVRQATLLTYEPLLFLVAVYLCLSGILIFGLRWLEGRVPTGR